MLPRATLLSAAPLLCLLLLLSPFPFPLLLTASATGPAPLMLPYTFVDATTAEGTTLRGEK
jgi:hypothetical protein